MSTTDHRPYHSNLRAWIHRSALVLLAVLPLSDVHADDSDGYTHTDTGLHFPAQLGALTLQGVYHYLEPGMGIALSYRLNNQAEATIEIYANKKRIIADRLPPLRQQAALALSAVYAGKHRGMYREVSVLHEGYMHLNGEQKQPTAYAYTVELHIDNPCCNSAITASKQIKHIMLSVFQEHFIRIDYTQAKTAEKQGGHQRTAFLRALSQLVQNGTAPRKATTRGQP